MKILTCIKQVPASSNVDVDPETGVLIRDGKNVKMNPYDLYALETAYLLKARSGAHVHTVTMGPPSAADVLREALMMGSDGATLLSDPRFAGADVLATAYALSQMLRRIGFDLIICGKQTTDGDTAQVGPEIAEFLDVPHVSYVRDVDLRDDKTLRIRTVDDRHEDVLDIKLPCLITVDKDANTPRLPSFKRKRSTRDIRIETWTLDDLSDKEATHYGLRGSPTQVESIFPPERQATGRIHSNLENPGKTLFDILVEQKWLRGD